MPTLTTVDEFKRAIDLSLTDTTEDQRLDELLDGVEAAVERFTHRKFASATYTEYHDGNNRPLLATIHRPVTSITSVKVDATGYYGHGSGAFADATHVWTIGTDFVPRKLSEDEENPGLLVALKGTDFHGAGIWPKGIGNIQVVYVAGYSTPPADLVLALHQLGAGVRRGVEKGGMLGGETIGKYSYRLLSGGGGEQGGGSIANAREILAGYRELAI